MELPAPWLLTTPQVPVLALPTPRASPSPPWRALAPAPSPASPQLLPTWEVVYSDPRKEAALLPFEGAMSLLWTLLAVAEGQAQMQGRSRDARWKGARQLLSVVLLLGPGHGRWRSSGGRPPASWAADMLLGHPAAGSCVWGLLAWMGNAGSAWPGWAVRPGKEGLWV